MNNESQEMTTHDREELHRILSSPENRSEQWVFQEVSRYLIDAPFLFEFFDRLRSLAVAYDWEVKQHTRNGHYLINRMMKAFEEELDPALTRVASLAAAIEEIIRKEEAKLR